MFSEKIHLIVFQLIFFFPAQFRKEKTLRIFVGSTFGRETTPFIVVAKTKALFSNVRYNNYLYWSC